MIFGTLQQQFMTNIVLNDIYAYSLEGATKMKQLSPFLYKLIFSNHTDLLNFGIHFKVCGK